MYPLYDLILIFDFHLFVFWAVILVPELFKKLRETPGNNFHQVSCKSEEFSHFLLNNFLIKNFGVGLFLVLVVLVVVLVAFRLVVRVVASRYCDYQEESHQNHHQDHQNQK